ncbi:hypothetical protein JG688_00015942 [Phytophthora aleatoria]|uniref:ZSWIM1/3 RNaseH-like domain-containing protein n=1 Tax=Phytophthora aleatoria TaxID=2496075 RepID=A0A8J5M2E4_9STRA|nr:hypothetical protein JG688_00015942 [Phytophthora aleatoria]
MPGIEMMVEARAATPSIYNFIRSNSNHRVNMDDVRNLLTRMRNTGVQLSDNGAVAELILGFNQDSPKNVSSVHESERGDTGVISFTSGHMVSMLDSFPEVLQMDCTHKTNRYEVLS